MSLINFTQNEYRTGQKLYNWNSPVNMGSYFVLDNIRLKVTGIDTDYQIKTTTKPYIGGYGSYTGRVASGGRSLEIPCMVGGKNIRNIIRLKSTKKPVTLVSPSPARYNGYYIVTGVKHRETKRGMFQVTINLQEYTPYKVTGNLVTMQDNINMTVPNMVTFGNRAALEEFVFNKSDYQGKTCSMALKTIKGKKKVAEDTDYSKLFKLKPECKKYLERLQCWYLYNHVCRSDRTLFQHVYPGCRNVIDQTI